jgi:hypothetical protein
MLAGDPRFDKPYRAGYALALLGLLLAADFPGRASDLLHVAYLPGFAWMAVVAATATSLRGTERGSARAGRRAAWGSGLALSLVVALRVAAAYAGSGRAWLLYAAMSAALIALAAWILWTLSPRWRAR